MNRLLDLFCGRGGWTDAARAKGWQAHGYDTVNHGYSGQLIMQRLPVDDEQIMRHRPTLVVASPPCEEFARCHLPWLRTVDKPDETLLRWAIGLTARLPVPVVIECSRFAARHVSGGRFVGPYVLWGDVPALLPKIHGHKSHRTGENPAARALINPTLADWIIETARAKGI
jgi:hypothetical protein